MNKEQAIIMNELMIKENCKSMVITEERRNGTVKVMFGGFIGKQYLISVDGLYRSMRTGEGTY